MPFPTGWPSTNPSGIRSARIFFEDTATANFEDMAILFIDLANSVVATPVLRAGDERAVVAIGQAPFGGGVAVRDERQLGGAVPSTGIPKAKLFSGSLWISNDSAGGGATLEFSFDGTNVHGKLLPGESRTYRNRYESGIAFRGAGAVFRVEGW